MSLLFIPSARCTLPFTFCQSVIKKRRSLALRMLDLLCLRLGGWRMACRGIEELNRLIPTWTELRKIKYVHRGWKHGKFVFYLSPKHSSCISNMFSPGYVHLHPKRNSNVFNNALKYFMFVSHDQSSVDYTRAKFHLSCHIQHGERDRVCLSFF